jgi:hypothetical protein
MRDAVDQCNLSSVPRAVKWVIEKRSWRERYEHMRVWRFDRFADFITAKIVDGGCGWEPQLVEGLLAKSGDIDAIAMFRKAMTAPKHVHADASNRSIKPRHGTTAAYTLARLMEERPDLYERVKAGEISANAAAVEAGWRRKPTALDQLRRWWGRASDEERRTFDREREEERRHGRR